jgi:inosine/xanthosine triphosphate pyrophosphatase family protein
MMVLKTSNQRKINEFKLANIPDLQILPGEDHLEIQSDDHILVAAYKAQSSGENVIIEDSILSIENDNGEMESIIDIKFKLGEIKSNIHIYKHLVKKAIFTSTIAVKLKDKIFVQTFSFHGYIGEPYRENGPVFGFDDVFYIEHEKELKSMHMIKTQFDKACSPRINCLQLFFSNFEKENFEAEGFYTYETPLPEWKGEYQS